MAQTTSFKDYINRAAIRMLGEHIQAAHAKFDLAAFEKKAMRGLAPLEFTARTQHVAKALRAHLPEAMPRALGIIQDALPPPLEGDEGMFSERYWLWPLSDFVRDYGAATWRDSLDTCYRLTQSFTAEFAIRPLLSTEPDKTLEQLLKWTRDDSAHVRRLCSEGPRPRLPWAGRLDMPRAPVFRILNTLRRDPARYVQKSVANHLNDIGKSDPAWLIDAMTSWNSGAGDNTRWIIKHALRTQIKAGDAAALKLIGYGKATLGTVNLDLAASRLQIGDSLNARLRLEAKGRKSQALLIDWIVHFARKNGSLSPKVFKGKTVELEPGERFEWEKTFDLKPRRTRSLYPGEHRLEVQINGDVVAVAAFTLDAEAPD